MSQKNFLNHMENSQNIRISNSFFDPLYYRENISFYSNNSILSNNKESNKESNKEINVTQNYYDLYSQGDKNIISYSNFYKSLLESLMNEKSQNEIKIPKYLPMVYGVDKKYKFISSKNTNKINDFEDEKLEGDLDLSSVESVNDNFIEDSFVLDNSNQFQKIIFITDFFRKNK